jgi:hypothetical protein
VLDRASIRNANLQALQALKGELASTNPIVAAAGMQVEEPGMQVEEPSVSIEPHAEPDENVSRGLKRKFDEISMDEDPALSDDAGADTSNVPLKVNQDGTVEQADTVR